MQNLGAILVTKIWFKDSYLHRHIIHFPVKIDEETNLFVNKEIMTNIEDNNFWDN